MDGSNERLLTPGEVAALFRVDPKTVIRWAASGRISSIRTPGGHRRFRESEVHALLRGASETAVTVGGGPIAWYAEREESWQQPARVPGSRGPGKTELSNQTDEVPSEISVSVYLDTDNDRVITQVVKNLDELVEALGYHGPIDTRIERGSFVRRSRAKFNGALSSHEARVLMAQFQRALELNYVDGQQAEVDRKAAESVSNLIRSLNDVPNACIRAGSVLLVKYTTHEGPVILSHNLSPLEMKVLERHPGIQQDPQSVIQLLALAKTEEPKDEL